MPTTDQRGLFRSATAGTIGAVDPDAAATVVGISVQSQPTKLTYTYGDTLDLTGLVAHLIYNDGTYKDVAFANFGTYGITVSPIDGTAVTMAMNGTTVTVSYGDLTADTDALTVNKAIPAIITPPVASNIYAGQSLSASALTGGAASVPGAFAWTDGTQIVTVSGSYSVTFTPADTVNYAAVTLQVTVTVTSGGGGGGGGTYPSDAVVNPTTASFDKNPSGADNKDITVTLQNGSYYLIAVKNGSYTLVTGTDYTVSGNQITIKASYLDTLPVGSQIITFKMSGGTDPQLTVTVTDTTPAVIPPPTPWVNPFADVKSSDWFYGDVEYVYTHGLMTGTSTNPMLFSPQMSVTRGMIVTILYRAAGSPDVSGLSNPFSDVAGGQYYRDAVIWAAANGIVAGIGNGKYDPDANITRQDLAVILYRYAQWAGIELPVTQDYTGFTDDAHVANYAKDAIEAFFKAGIINGYPDGSFQPNGTATRAEVAAMIHRFFEITND